jgi:glucokinase
MRKGSGDPDLVLAGDIGGTKTHLGLFRMGRHRPEAAVIETYPSREAPRLEGIVERFRKSHDKPVVSACFGIAGPVYRGMCRTTNLPWVVSERLIRKRFLWDHVRLINDLAATALAIPLLEKRELIALNRARARKGENLALLAPGTGLGEALLVHHRGSYIPVSTEAGHVDFSPNNEEEVDLWRYLRKRFAHVSPERVVSGPGLVNIYTWLRDGGRYREPLWLRRRLQEADPARAITETALRNGHPLCSETMRVFLSVFGAAAGNLALTGMVRGGVYLGGGICPKILPALKQEAFMKAFISKGRFSDLMREIPVWVILNEKAALLGAAWCAFFKQQMEELWTSGT